MADEADDDSDAKPPILFLHGFFGRPSLLEPWTRYFEPASLTATHPPFRDVTRINDDVLRSTGIEDCFNVALDAYDRLDEPPIVIGHSMGGLLTQKIAAARSPRAVVLLASVPPGILWPQLPALPHLFPVLPAVLAGKPFLPSSRTMRNVPLNTLPAAEQDELIPQLVRDSGRVFREMSLGASSTRVTPPMSPVRCSV